MNHQIATMNAGDWALIVMAAAWVLLVLFLCYVLIGVLGVLTSTKNTIDAFRQETVPLLKEVVQTVERSNRELDRVDDMLQSSTQIVRRAERLTGLLEQAAASPLIKLISVGAGLRKAGQRFNKKA